jgi:hypothetical protein
MWRIISTAAAVVLCAVPAAAYGIAGNRYFPGTLTFDDPAVADELFILLYSRLEYPTRKAAAQPTQSDRRNLRRP